MNEKNIQQKVKYDGKVFVCVGMENSDTEYDCHAHLFHRTDYWEDGSQTEWYGIELTKEQYERALSTGGDAT